MSTHHSARWASGAKPSPPQTCRRNSTNSCSSSVLRSARTCGPTDRRIVRFVRSNRKIRYVPETLLARTGAGRRVRPVSAYYNENDPEKAAAGNNDYLRKIVELASGNAICAPTAAEFVRSFMECVA